MDPYLEDKLLWPSFHHQLVSCLHEILLPGLVDRYRTRISGRRYVTEQAGSAGAVPEEHQEEYIEIFQRSDGRLVTLVDVVSPANKTTAAGWQAYHDTRRTARAAGMNLVEIDLVLQGWPTLQYSRDGLPDWDYAVTVTRSTQPERYEIYTATLQKRLPRFRLPLASDDRDTVIDLHAAFSHCYDRGRFSERVNYLREPSVPLSDEDRNWLLNVFKRETSRQPPSPQDISGLAHTPEPTPSHEQIAVAAYYLWQKEGCPRGRDRDHWRTAEEELKRQAGRGILGA
jgi:hypothetical protein